MRVSSYRVTWCAPPVSSLSRAPASVHLSAVRHRAAAHMLRTSAQKERLAILLIMLHEQVPQASTTLGFVQVFARWLVTWFLAPTLLLAPVCLSHHLMWMCLSDWGHASFICALVLGDEVQDGSGENKTAPWRPQSGCKFWTATCGTNLRLCVRLQWCEKYGGSGQSMYEPTILWGVSMRSFSLLDGSKLQQHRQTQRNLDRNQMILQAYVLYRTCGSWAQTRAPDLRHRYCTRYRASEHHLHIGRCSVSGRSGTNFGCHRGKKRLRWTLEMHRWSFLGRTNGRSRPTTSHCKRDKTNSMIACWRKLYQSEDN